MSEERSGQQNSFERGKSSQPSSMERNILDVIIVSYNVAHLLEDCLGSLLSEKGVDVVITVVDNNSCDGTVAMVREKFPQVNLVASRKNLGFSAANNLALKGSRSKYALLLNPDTKVLPGAIKKMVDYMEANGEVGALGPKLLNPDGSLQYSARTFPSLTTQFLESTYLFRIFPQSRFFGQHFMSYWDHGQEKKVDWVSGAALMVRREAIEKTGLLDEGFFMYSEEVDWCYRIKRAGYEVVYFPQAEIIHYDARSSEDEARRLEMVLSGRYRFFARHYPSWQGLFLRLLVLGGLVIRIIFCAGASLLPLKGRERFRKKLHSFVQVFLWHGEARG
ncbi:glycosyltransferase family 2 protein [Candidatus Hakubella thermalkaliphila]|uniref:Rhamnosyltransferase n=2 Tax=Candidatus Hakubella thermalkaliphila TaxID=2754717 RepID=A0A6V8NZP2_9ACTN|nr:glycosyltransferase family 2 protein [Candidatus Hakubella thermalkaliphila]GFP24910.1 rhamnosyltransferase [Candidatus Hakubella thermalkaliphila]GFP26713.1 rhamnosyltransferase [Candidatus Hakubella thermalkaliphila]